MIVKDESQVIRRSLSSIKPFIDYWVIVDTGSTDGTQEIIQKYMSDIPGRLHQSKWVDFSYHRNEALYLSRSKGEYVLFIDADEEFLPSPNFSFSFLKDDYYLGTFVLEDGKQFQRVLAIKNSIHFLWVGAVHEMLVHRKKVCQGIVVDGVKIAYRSGGYRSRDPLTFKKDAVLLEKDIKKNPKDARSIFFLSLTYERLNELSLALECFERRSRMPEKDQEVFYSVLSMGLIQMRQGQPSQIFLKTLEKAHRLLTSRPEPIYFIAITLESKGELSKAYNLLSSFVYSFNKNSIGYQTFFNIKIAEIDIPILYARICYRLLKYKESLHFFRKTISHPEISQENKKHIEMYLDRFIF
jgi:glycosyltransferase involved in cell wall biosynthesis